MVYIYHLKSILIRNNENYETKVRTYNIFPKIKVEQIDKSKKFKVKNKKSELNSIFCRTKFGFDFFYQKLAFKKHRRKPIFRKQRQVVYKK